MRLSGRSLALVWLLGAAVFALQTRATMRGAQNELPRARAYLRSARGREAEGRLDSAIAYARAPLTVTAAGDTVRALAYMPVPHVAPRVRLPAWTWIIAAVWFFRIPIALVALTLAYFAHRRRRNMGISVKPS